MLNGYQDLDVWKRAMDLAAAVNRFVLALPLHERFELARQLRRAAVSVPSNIAEGYGRDGSASFVQFLRIARGSVFEIETQLLLAVRYGYVQLEAIGCLLAMTGELSRMLLGLIRSVRERGARSKG